MIQMVVSYDRFILRQRFIKMFLFYLWLRLSRIIKKIIDDYRCGPVKSLGIRFNEVFRKTSVFFLKLSVF